MMEQMTVYRECPECGDVKDIGHVRRDLGNMVKERVSCCECEISWEYHYHRYDKPRTSERAWKPLHVFSFGGYKPYECR